MGIKAKLSLFYITTASTEEAEKLAHSLLEAKLIACANILPQMTSVYRWEGQTTKSQEAVLLLKSKAQLAKKIETHVLKHHSYTVPCLLEIPLSFVAEKYGLWLESELADRHDRRISQRSRRKKKPVKR